MTLPKPLRVVFLLVSACLIGSGLCPCVKAESNSVVASNPAGSQTTPKDSAAKQSSDEDKSDATAFGVLAIKDLHKIIREERIAALTEIDTARKETLEYLSQERQMVVETLTAERRTTMVELEIMGNRMIQNAISESKALIDHLILRILELALAAILLLSFVGFVSYRLWWREKPQ